MPLRQTFLLTLSPFRATLIWRSRYFSGSSCGNGALASNIWIYACTTAGDEQSKSGDCPHHENVIWRFTGKLLRSAVPAGPPSGTGPVPWDTCLTSTDSASPLNLAACNETDPRQHWTVAPAANKSYFQLRQGGKCVSSVTTGPPPPPPVPPAPPAPAMPPVANLFHDQRGAEIRGGVRLGDR